MGSRRCVCIALLRATRGSVRLTKLVAKPCGHVICQPCVTKFMTPHDVPDPHASKEEQERTAKLHGLILCYVCEADITPRDPKAEADEHGTEKGNGKKSKKKV